MASHGIISGTVSQNATRFAAKVYWKQVSQSVENNRTMIRVYSFVQTDSPTYDWNGSCFSWSTTVNGVTRTLPTFASNSDSGWTYPSGWTDGATVVTTNRTELIPETGIIYQDFVIDHNADGAKSVTLSHTYSLNSGGSGPGNVSVSGALDLNTIPRASQPTVNLSTVTMRDQTVTISTNPASSVFRHTILYSFGGTSGTIASNVEASTTWTPPIALASQIPNTVSGTATITCQTYSGTTLVGTKTVDITLSIPADIVPTVSIAVTGVDLYSGYYVQNKSKVAVTLTTSGAYGSTISGRSTTVNGATYTTDVFTTGVLTTVGDNYFGAAVIDSRGRTAAAYATIAVTAYANPQATSLSAYRCDADATPNIAGTHVSFSASGLISPIGDTNTAYSVVRFRESGASEWAGSQSSALYSPAISNGFLADVNKAFEVQLFVQDYFSSTTRTVNISTAFALMDFHSSGTGMAIGKVAEGRGVLDVGGRQFNDGALALRNGSNLLLQAASGSDDTGDIIFTDHLEQELARILYAGGSLYYRNSDLISREIWHDGNSKAGANANGYYVQHPDGTMICYRALGNITGLSIANGSYWTSAAYAFPAAFTSNVTNYISYFVADGTGTPRNALPILHYGSNWQWYISNTTGATITQLLTISLLAIGRWY